jgi:hypothetical protein
MHEFVRSVCAGDLHAKRVLSLTNAALGVINAAALSIAAIGQGLAQAAGLNAKHAVKQVDRLLSNAKVDLDQLFPLWIRHVLGTSQQILVALDWTDFDADDHTTLMLSLVGTGRHGRAMPLLWKTVPKSELKGRRSQIERDLLVQFEKCLPDAVRVTVLADRAFGSQDLYEELRQLAFDFIIRFRGNIEVEAEDGERRTAAEWVPRNGRPKLLLNARVTQDRALLPAVVCVKAAGMAEPWCLATNRTDLTASRSVQLYSRRFSIEENFRDTKDNRFGLGLSATHIGRTDRRDRLLFVAALAQALLTVLGMAAEATGLDRMLKVNTAKERSHSLQRQGLFWYGAIPAMPEDRLRVLMEAFGKLVSQDGLFVRTFGLDG